jgi:4-methylaminobutanoate oxidase (formaldehyde-forming)
MHTLDILRLEKKFLHWGHDITSETNPIEAGLSFAVNLKNKNNFIGRNAIENIINKKAFKRQLDLFSLRDKFKPGEPLLLHDEPIYSKNKLVGSTTSSNYSFCYKKNICLAYVRNDVAKEDLHIEVEGKKYRLKHEIKPLHDPSSALMRN